MRRMIVQPAQADAAVAELKSWLAISRSSEDGLLEGLVRSAFEVCEGFTGQAPLSQQVEERIAPLAGHHPLLSRPVRGLVSAHIEAQDGTRQSLDPAALNFSIDTDGKGSVTTTAAHDARALILRLDVGIAEDWSTLPPALQQGMIRLAAHEYRARDRTGPDRQLAFPPASVTALWAPWRIMRLT